jgi:hypothetical protein
MKAEPVILHQCEWVLDGLTGDKFIRINGRTYQYRILPGEVELTNPEGEVHTVSRVACTCNDAKFRRRVTGCRHRDALKRLGLLARAAALKKQQPQEQGAAS